MQSWQIFGVGLLAAVATVVIKQMRADLAVTVRLAGSVVLLGAVVAMSAPIYSYLSALISRTAPGQYAEVLIKALGVALLTHLGAEICRDCGEGGIATTVELAGKCEILLLSMPLISSILGSAAELLDRSV